MSMMRRGSCMAFSDGQAGQNACFGARQQQAEGSRNFLPGGRIWTPGKNSPGRQVHSERRCDPVALMKIPRLLLFASLLLACGPARLAHAQKPGLPDLADPMIFVVAHGGPDACGPGCSEWIAAEGVFDNDAEARFRRFLATLNGRQLPVMFDSRGGNIGQAFGVGRILRERRMTASVGETFPDSCRTGIAAHPACRRIMQASRDLRARLRTGNGRCVSACVYALIGASRRQVPPNAFVGVHAGRLTGAGVELARSIGGNMAAQLLAEQKRYVLLMGVEPGIVDLAYKTPSSSVHRLTRDEMAKYGVETRAPFETSWMAYEVDSLPQKPVVMLKTLSQARGTDASEFRTTTLSLVCADRLTGAVIAVRRELASNEIGVPAAVRLVVGSSVLEVLQLADHPDGADHYRTVANWQFVRAALAQGALTLVESFSPKDAPAWSRETSLSTKGLESALPPDVSDCRQAAR